ncbi:phosphoesterase family-domain-containing protein [Globomyces pollinis-pini]|nr:phosphoesterase family-domain-containing protein [Globomyces pollinis-pini]
MLFSLLLSVVSSAPTSTFDRFFVIVFENTNYDVAIKDNYFGKVLPSKGRLLTNYHGRTHPSQPNYIAMVGGSRLGVTTNDNYDLNDRSVVDLLESAGKSWITYQQQYPGNCFTGSSSGAYVRKHNPFISFKNISANSKRCAKIVNADQLNSDIRNGKVADYVYFTPDLKNSAHDTNISTASRWFQGFFDPILSNALFKNTLFLVTFDENDPSNDRDNNRIYSLLIGPGVQPGSVDNTAYNHYSQLATLEKNWKLDNLGLNDKTANPFY